ncbi:MAG: hypothetical protein AAGF85_00640 [Bacteroidota bacterium]
MANEEPDFRLKVDPKETDFYLKVGSFKTANKYVVSSVAAAFCTLAILGLITIIDAVIHVIL